MERICANAEAMDRDVVVHLVDPFVDRGGRVWSTDQSPVLLMNTIASQVTVFTDPTVTCRGPIRPGPSLFDWARMLPLMEPFDEYPAAVLAEAERLGPDSYPSRSFYGHYLSWVLRRLRQTAPPEVTIQVYPQLAVGLDEQPDGTLTVRLADRSTVDDVSVVVLAQGHLDMPLGLQESRLSQLAGAAGLTYVAPANPAEVDLSAVLPGEPVALRGMGLNFFDYLAMLTLGRGGRFDSVEGRLAYRASGREPVIYAGSRRGVPYHARGENQKGVSGRHQPVFLTADVIERLRARADRGHPQTFRAEVWPLIAREVELVYYTALIRQRRGEQAAERFQLRYVAADPALVGDLLAESGIGEEDRWDWDLIARPHAGRRFGSPAQFRTWLLDLLRRDAERAQGGNVDEPVKAALDVLRDIRNEVRLIVDHSGLTGTSYRDELTAWYTPLNAYLSIGPPVRRIEELIALIEAGVVTVLGPGADVDVSADGFAFRASDVDGAQIVVRTLIEARLPELDIRRTSDPLLGHLRRTNRCRPYRIPDPAGPGYESGGLSVTPGDHHLVLADGREHPRVFAYGVPTEAVHWVTAAGARPGVNSVMLNEADEIAREALLVPVPVRADAPTMVQLQGGFHHE
ncbi:FAD/NAD(P)-binding protein [Dactylosporangium sp. CA-092794]|uniref:FAD/NAD(P)-binding protein n=1 Tax=Dactylosporangium sp. CA-092794 TaxID=3239929 RepID=UPI003D8FE609